MRRVRRSTQDRAAATASAGAGRATRSGTRTGPSATAGDEVAA